MTVNDFFRGPRCPITIRGQIVQFLFDAPIKTVFLQFFQSFLRIRILTRCRRQTIIIDRADIFVRARFVLKKSEDVILRNLIVVRTCFRASIIYRIIKFTPPSPIWPRYLRWFSFVVRIAKEVPVFVTNLRRWRLMALCIFVPLESLLSKRRNEIGWFFFY